MEYIFLIFMMIAAAIVGIVFIIMQAIYPCSFPQNQHLNQCQVVRVK